MYVSSLGWGQDTAKLHVVAPFGYPFGEEFRQNLVLDECVGVEPVSVDCHASDCDRWKFHLDDAEDGNSNGSAPSLVIIIPEIVLESRVLWEGKSSVVR